MTYETLLRFLKHAKWDYDITTWLNPGDQPTFYDYVTRPGGTVNRQTLSAHGVGRDNIEQVADFALV
jgi:hypothetical protein